jgi:hypothetical protein
MLRVDAWKALFRGVTEFSAFWDLQCGATVDRRPTAPQIMLFSSISVDGARKGNMQFCGLAVLTHRIPLAMSADAAASLAP